jgi:hypothetical protein
VGNPSYSSAVKSNDILPVKASTSELGEILKVMVLLGCRRLLSIFHQGSIALFFLSNLSKIFPSSDQLSCL